MRGWRGGGLEGGLKSWLDSWRAGLEGWRAGGLEGWRAGGAEGWKVDYFRAGPKLLNIRI